MAAPTVHFETKDGVLGQKKVMSVGPFRQAAQGRFAVERNVSWRDQEKEMQASSEGETRLYVERNTM
jgi:hypothetical protein